jgi:cytochrome c553
MNTLVRMTLAIFLTAMGATLAAADHYPMARKLVHSQGCLACHHLEGSGGDFACSLDGISSRIPPEKIHERLKKGQDCPTEPFMPSYGNLTDAEMDQVVQFLIHLPPQKP